MARVDTAYRNAATTTYSNEHKPQLVPSYRFTTLGPPVPLTGLKGLQRFRRPLPERYRERLDVRGSLAHLDLNQLPDELLARIAAGEDPRSVLTNVAVAALGSGAVEQGERESVTRHGPHGDVTDGAEERERLTVFFEKDGTPTHQVRDVSHQLYVSIQTQTTGPLSFGQ